MTGRPDALMPGRSGAWLAALTAAVRTAAVSTAALVTAAASTASAQTVREFTSSRQHRGETRLDVEVQYSGGKLRIEPTTGGRLYTLRLTYDDNRFAPVVEFDRSAGMIVLGTAPLGRGGIRVGSRTLDQAATILLGTEVETSLGMALSATEARAELGGLRLNRLRIESAATRADIRFSEANPIRCARAEINAGAGEMIVSGLGFAQCSEIDVNGGVGRVTLDFSGRWNGRLHVNAEMAMGELVLRLPRDARIRIGMDKFLTSFAPTNLTRSADGRTWTSAGYDPSGTRLDIDVETAVGGVTVEWID